ncbi:MAG: TetR/AcrR family transcriptional regulator [Acidimicrobiia bacterium]
MASTAATKTKWGDRERRRADILGAARDRITNAGYLACSMRDIAADAGVSPATLYSYFATKEELFATLYAEAIRAHTAALAPVVGADHNLDRLLALVIEAYLGLYRSFGRHFTLWSTMRHDANAETAPFPKELIVELRDATIENNRLLMDGIRAAARRGERHIVDERLVPSFLWTSLNGLADHFTSERRSLDPFPASHLVEFAARRLAIAITDPDAA